MNMYHCYIDLHHEAKALAFSSAVDLPGQITLLGSEGAMRLEHNRALTLMRPGQEPKVFHPPESKNALITASKRDFSIILRFVIAR